MADPVAKLSALLPHNTPQTPRRVLGRSRTVPLPPAKPRPLSKADVKAASDKVLHPKGNKSIASQIGGVFAGLPSGVAHLTHDALVDASAVYRIPHDMIEGDLPVSALWHDSGGLNHKYFPLTTGMAESMEDTAGRLAQLGPIEVSSVGGRKVETYGDLARNGGIVQGLLNDAMNVSIVAGAAGAALKGAGSAAEAAGATRTAAGLGRAADVAKVTSRLGGRAANAPMEAIGGVLKGGKSMWREAGQRLEARLYESLPKDSALGRRMVRTITKEGQVLKQAAVDTRIQPGRLSEWVRTNLGVDSGLVDRTRHGERPGRDAPSLLEQEVGLTRAVGVAQADKMVSDTIGASESLKAHVAAPVNLNMVSPGETMTPDGQAMAHAYENGTLPPEAMARIDKVTDAYHKWAARDTDRALAGHGQKPLDPRHVGEAPLDEQVTGQLADAGLSKADIDTLANLRANGYEWKDLAPLVPDLEQILLDPDVYPAPWREAMHVFGKGAEVADEAGIAHAFPRTPDEILAAGIDRPVYMSGKRTDPHAPRNEPLVPTSEGFEGIKSISGEHHKSTLGHGQYSLANAASALGRSASTTEYNHILTGYMRHHDIKGPLDVLSVPTKTKNGELPAIDWQDLHDEAARQVDAQNLGGMSPGKIEARTAEIRGRMVYSELQARGYDVLNGNKLDPKPGDFNPSDTFINFEHIDPDTTVVIPAGLKAKLRLHTTGADTNVVLNANQATNAWFKRNVLPLNAHWTIGDAISNALTAWISGKISPDEMFAAGRAIKRIDPVLEDELFNRPQLMKSGLKMQVARELNPTLAERAAPHTAPGRGLRAAQNAGFRFNEFVNRAQRHEYVYAKLDKELRARGLSDGIEGIPAGDAKWKDPPVQKAINDVVNDANKTLGTWDEMSPLEQRFATQVFPFWSWIRHINSLVLRTAVDNPARVLWTLRIGAIGAEMDPDDIPSFLRGGIDTPAGRLNLNWTNPFYDVGSGALVSPDTLLRSVSPLMKAGTMIATGRDLNRNLNVVSHRPGTKVGMFDRISAAGYGLATSSPYGRGALNLAPTGEIPVLDIGTGPHRRYGTGQNILTPGTSSTVDNQSRWRKAGAIVNLPIPEPVTNVPTKAVSLRKRRTGLRRTGLGSGGLRRTGLGSG